MERRHAYRLRGSEVAANPNRLGRVFPRKVRLSFLLGVFCSSFFGSALDDVSKHHTVDSSRNTGFRERTSGFRRAVLAVTGENLWPGFSTCGGFSGPTPWFSIFLRGDPVGFRMLTTGYCPGVEIPAGTRVTWEYSAPGDTHIGRHARVKHPRNDPGTNLWTRSGTALPVELCSEPGAARGASARRAFSQV